MATRIANLNEQGIRIAAAAVALVAPIVMAVSPHFVGEPSATVTGTTGDLVCSWKEAGLGTNTVVDVCSADASATFSCVTKGGSVPASSKKTEVVGPVSVSASGVFGVINDQATGSLVVSAPSGNNLACPGGQTLELARTSYTNVVITDTTVGMSIQVPGTFSSACLLAGGC